MATTRTTSFNMRDWDEMVFKRDGPWVCIMVDSTGLAHWVTYALWYPMRRYVRTPAIQYMNWVEFEEVMAGT